MRILGRNRMIYPFILAGGAGTRLWPLARDSTPKQFLALQGDKTLFQDTVLRIHALGFERPIVLSADRYRSQVVEQATQIGVMPKTIILEPEGRGTAPAAVIAALLVAEQQPEDIVVLLPSDHVIDDQAAFSAAIREAVTVAQNEDLIVTLGIIPDRAETGFGYIHAGSPLGEYSSARLVVQFVEKPDSAQAAAFLESGAYFWNSGIFVFRARTLIEEFEKLAPDIVSSCRKALVSAIRDSDSVRLDKSAFEQARGLSIDVAIMEKTKRAAVIVGDFGWNDVGSWSALWSLRAHDRNGNALHGDIVVEDVKDSLIDSQDRLTAVVGLDNVIVVSAGDALLIANRARAQSVAPVVAHLKKNQRPEVSEHRVVVRPWGSYRSILSGAGFQVKEIIVNPGGRLSLQMHKKRAEHWIVVAGTAHVTCDDKVFDIHAGENTFVPLGAKHRLENFEQEALRLIEVQCGSYLGEDDIVRFEDIYGRADREA